VHGAAVGDEKVVSGVDPQRASDEAISYSTRAGVANQKEQVGSRPDTSGVGLRPTRCHAASRGGSGGSLSRVSTKRWPGAVGEKDAVLRKTCATYYDEHVPKSSIVFLGHSVGGITSSHYAHRAPLAFKAIMTLPQPTAFSAVIKGCDGVCPCCRRRFADAG
jgi:hypothetical protein